MLTPPGTGSRQDLHGEAASRPLVLRMVLGRARVGPLLYGSLSSRGQTAGWTLSLVGLLTLASEVRFTSTPTMKTGSYGQSHVVLATRLKAPRN